MDFRDKQWALLEPLIPPRHTRPDGRERPWRHARGVLTGILWVLRTGPLWRDVPDQYFSPATCHRRSQERSRTGVFEQILRTLADDLRDRGKFDLTECIVGTIFEGASKGAFEWAR